VLFLDSADEQACTQWVAGGVVGGVTTNATILAKEREPSVLATVKRILDHDPDELHVQVLSEDDATALHQAKTLSATDPRIRVKIPFVTSSGRYRSTLVRRAGSAGVKVNVTACTSLAQAFTALSLEPDCLSILWCRTREAGDDPQDVVHAVAARRDRAGLSTRIVIGSIREGADVSDALCSAADIVTVLPAVLEKWLGSEASTALAKQFDAHAEGLVL